MNDQAFDEASVSGSQTVPAWYPIAASSAVVRRKPIGVKRFGEALVMWRADDGRVVCLPDRCSHRSAALRTFEAIAADGGSSPKRTARMARRH